MKILIFIPIFIFFIPQNSWGTDITPQITHQAINEYDMIESCHFFLQSARPLTVQAESCSLRYEDKERSPFFYGHVFSGKQIFSSSDHLGVFKLSNGKITHLRNNYFDDQRNVSQTIIKKTNIDLLKKNKKDILIATSLKVAYDKLQTDGLTLDPVEELYECWDGIFYGNTTEVIVSLCSLSSRDTVSPNVDGWQADLIKSLIVK